MLRYGVAYAIATAALLVPRDWLEAPGASLRVSTVPVVVAAKDMPEGATIDRVALAVARWPAGTQPLGAYGEVDLVANRVARVPLYKGEAILPGRLAPEGTVAGPDANLTPGRRAYGIRINDMASLAGMVQLNSRVDIMVIIDDPTQRKRVAKLFMSNMRVLALMEALERAPDGSPIRAAVASIEVTEDQAEKLAHAAAQGALQLVLRGYGDPDSTSTSGAVADDVLTNIKRSRTSPVRRASASRKPR